MSSNGEYLLQSELVTWCLRHNRRAMVFDVGANVGRWTMSLVEEARRRGALTLLDLHAFEPVQEAFRVLHTRTSKDANESRVTKVQCALSCSDGTAEMHIASPVAGTNSLHRDAMAPSTSVIRVQTCRADTYCRENSISEIHFFKCDTEGHDFDVLQGAMGLFDEGKIGLFQFEYNHRWIYSRHFLKDVFDFVKGRHYLVGKLTRAGIELIPEWHPELERFFEMNYVVVHRGALEIYSHRQLKIDAGNTYA